MIVVKKYSILTFFIALLLIGNAALGQQGLTGVFGTYIGTRECINGTRAMGGDVEIAAKGNLQITNTGDLAVFGSFTNSGVLEILPGGSLHLYGDVQNGGAIIAHKGAHIYFYGNRWKNTIYASFQDGLPANSEAGGELLFVGTRPDIAPDWLAGTKALEGYSGGASAQYWEGASSAMDAAIRLQNSNGVYLSNSAAMIEGSLQWDVADGMLFLGNNDLIFTANGSVLNYGPHGFAITDGDGHVVKQRLDGGPWTFPLGPRPEEYTPASIQSVFSNTYHVNVKPYNLSTSIEEQLWREADGMNYTWNIYADRSEIPSTIALQHNSASNNLKFDSDANFVTRYGLDTSNSDGDFWNPGYWELNKATKSQPGILSSFGAVAAAELNWRTYKWLATSASSPYAYYTKSSTGFRPLKTSQVWMITAFPDNCNAVVEFSSGSEFGVIQYQVQRSSDGVNFSVVGTFQPQGDSSTYTFRDLPPETGDYYYRIALLDPMGSYSLSAVTKVSVNCQMLDPEIHLFPNPASEYITITGMTGNSDLVLLNLAGQPLYQAKTDRATHTINVRDLADETYIVRVQSGPRFTTTAIKFVKVHQ
ncbi:hypothetical protein GCM10023092_12970 [Rurimicrobium arvi]|uniref:Secretion system C-terminal sorting domain-containing protein n=2 Tax=Rurimicrobium arvi TaxID=2049916 RepID=A0ABP8MQS1_9BACT